MTFMVMLKNYYMTFMVLLKTNGRNIKKNFVTQIKH